MMSYLPPLWSECMRYRNDADTVTWGDATCQPPGIAPDNSSINNTRGDGSLVRFIDFSAVSSAAIATRRHPPLGISESLRGVCRFCGFDEAVPCTIDKKQPKHLPLRRCSTRPD